MNRPPLDDRGSGRTSDQIVTAPRDAIFVCAGPRDYTMRLARHLGRSDIVVVTADYDRVDIACRGSRRPIIIDHALPLGRSSREWENWGKIVDMAARQNARVLA
jgi:hypothetical protein